MQSRRYGHQLRHADYGFTIVELLIVVVIIAILAAITIVAYNGITQRANAAAAQSGAEQVAKKLATYAIDNNDTFPATLASLGFVNSGNLTYQYSVASGSTGYCATVLTSGASYYVGSKYSYTGSSSGTIDQLTPTSGSCPGQGSNTITNYSEDPGAEVGLDSYGPAGSGSSMTRDTSKSLSGNASVRVSMGQNAGTDLVGISLFQYSNVTTILAPNTTYTVSAWVWVPTGTVNIDLIVQGAGKSSVANPTQRTSATKNQWERIYNTFTTSSSGSIAIYAVNNAATATAGTQFWVDNIMVNTGTSPANYADGSTAGWIWNGATGLSTSTGPAV